MSWCLGSPMTPEEKKAYKKAWAAANPEKVAASKERYRKKKRLRDRVYYKENREKILAQMKAYREAHRDETLAKKKAWKEDNKDKVMAWYWANREKGLERMRGWHSKNKDKDLAYQKYKRDTDPCYKIGKTLRSRLRSALKRNFKSGSAVRDLGCSIEYLKTYLEGKFEPGMSWDNWAHDSWHIDHIVPLASFDLTDREQLLKACHYTNLQPLWAKDNLSKGDSI